MGGFLDPPWRLPPAPSLDCTTRASPDWWGEQGPRGSAPIPAKSSLDHQDLFSQDSKVSIGLPPPTTPTLLVANSLSHADAHVYPFVFFLLGAVLLGIQLVDDLTTTPPVGLSKFSSLPFLESGSLASRGVDGRQEYLSLYSRCAVFPTRLRRTYTHAQEIHSKIGDFKIFQSSTATPTKLSFLAQGPSTYIFEYPFLKSGCAFTFCILSLWMVGAGRVCSSNFVGEACAWGSVFESVFPLSHTCCCNLLLSVCVMFLVVRGGIWRREGAGAVRSFLHVLLIDLL